VYNRSSKAVINLFGIPNREKYGVKTINLILDALKKGGHQVKSFEGDKDLVDNLEEFMPRVLKGERPGLVFNLSYGIQGAARYTHVPGILEMVGIPYLGSNPLAHSIALDKVLTKMVFKQHGIPTPDFMVVDSRDFKLGKMKFPLIVKPRMESTSMGLKVCHDEDELREAVGVIVDNFDKFVLVEAYIKGREINVAVVGNDPPESLPVLELKFGRKGQDIYTYEDKLGQSGRTVGQDCPAKIPKKTEKLAKELAVRAFNAIGCYDMARVDMRIDKNGFIYLLEINSLPSLGVRSSYIKASEAAGYDYDAAINRLADSAYKRYFGVPESPAVIKSASSMPDKIFAYLTGRRDRIEKTLEEFVGWSSRSDDPVGIRHFIDNIDKRFEELGLTPEPDLTNGSSAWTWTNNGIEGSTLFLGHLDISLKSAIPSQNFKKAPDKLFGEGIGTSRAPLAMILWAFRALKAHKVLKKIPVAVTIYSDEGKECRYSNQVISASTGRSSRVFGLRPGNPGNKVITRRRGQRKFHLTVEGKPMRPGQGDLKSDLMKWVCMKIDKISSLSSRKDRVSVSGLEISTQAYPMLLPNHAVATILVTYPNTRKLAQIESEIKSILDEDGVSYFLDMISDRPPLNERKINSALYRELKSVADKWEIELDTDSSLIPAPSGLVPASTPVICGTGPIATNVYTPYEGVDRFSVMQRTLLLAQYLLEFGSKN